MRSRKKKASSDINFLSTVTLNHLFFSLSLLLWFSAAAYYSHRHCDGEAHPLSPPAVFNGVLLPETFMAPGHFLGSSVVSDFFASHFSDFSVSLAVLLMKHPTSIYSTHAFFLLFHVTDPVFRVARLGCPAGHGYMEGSLRTTQHYS